MHFIPFAVTALFGFAIAAPVPAGLVVRPRDPFNTDIFQAGVATSSKAPEPRSTGLLARPREPGSLNTGSMQAGVGFVEPSLNFGSRSLTDPIAREHAAEADILLPPLEKKDFNSGVVSDVIPVALNKRQLNTGDIDALPAVPVAPVVAPPAANYVLPPPSI